MQCQKCQHDITENESFTHQGETLCEDCYLDALSPASPCNPWAVYNATRTRKSSGLEGMEGLTPAQTKLYEFIKSKQKVTPEELMKHFNINQRELGNLFVTLRHCELVRGQKEGDIIYFVPF
ncbi:hypothetical protein ACFLWG_02160 [Chloroflexota bacterium]